MKGLLYKNFISCRIWFLLFGFMLIMLGIYGFMFGDIAVTNARLTGSGSETFIGLMTLLYFFLFALVISLCPEIFKADEKVITYSFYFSVPQSAKGLIQSKYYFLLLVDLGTLFASFLMDTVLMLKMGEYAVSNLTTCITLFSSILIFMSINIPFLVRYGSKANKEKASLYILIFFSIIAIYGMFGDISFLFTENILLAIIEYLHSPKMIFLTSLTPYVAVIMYYLSYRISLKLYRKGVECYDQ